MMNVGIDPPWSGWVFASNSSALRCMVRRKAHGLFSQVNTEMAHRKSVTDVECMMFMVVRSDHNFPRAESISVGICTGRQGDHR